MLSKPAKLSREGSKAYKAIMALLTRTEQTNTGGCKAFYSPKEWADRGEEYGRNSLLIVCHDGGDLVPFFDYNRDAWSFKQEMETALNDAGFYAEQCTSWYTAIYPAN
jgi:hypothetical protein